MMRGPAFLTYGCTLLIVACGGRTEPAAEEAAETRGAFETASGVVYGDSGSRSSDHRIVPLGVMEGDVEVLHGDPEAAGQPFVMRIRELPGTRVPVHSHPVDEHITVVQGSWYFALGEAWDSAALREMTAGTYAFAPAGRSMYAYSPDGAVVQVHGVGPFHIRWAHGSATLDDADAASHFRFRKEEEVRAPRGRGRIRQGYASGDIVQYEVAAADGSLFMADEADLRRD
jgi:quercetin dioxygenase-like cupin family protein